MAQRCEIVHGRQPWFLARAEQVVHLEGVLRRRDAGVGPGDRGGLVFALHAQDRVWPIYSVSAEEILERYEAHRVSIEAKAVDLRAEGGVEELWIATIEAGED